jgi:DNA-binding NtrC family response regulator
MIHASLPELPHLESTMGMARNSRAPILISASPDRALSIAHGIIADVTDAVILVIREVHTLDLKEQAALFHLLNTFSAKRRVITTTSVDLFECVKQGTFSEDLFYRLNTLHIMLS